MDLKVELLSHVQIADDLAFLEHSCHIFLDEVK